MLQRSLALAGTSSRQQPLNTDVLVDRWPMNTQTTPDQTPAPALTLTAMSEPWVPSDGDDECPTVLQHDTELILSYLDVDCSYAVALTR